MTVTTPTPERVVVDSLIVAPAVLGLLWSAKEWIAAGWINSQIAPDKNDEPLLNKSDQIKNMNEISIIITVGVKSFQKVEYFSMNAYVVLFSGVLLVATE